MAPSAVNDGARALEGLVARWNKDLNTSVTTGGTSTVYTYAANQTLSAYYDGMMLGVDFHTACGATPTINVDAIGAKSLKWPNGTALAASDVATGQKAILVYDGTDMIVLTGGGNVAAKDTGAGASEIGLNDQAYANVASATTTDIGAATSRNVNITGTTTITGLGTVAAGIERHVKFAGILTLTHNGTSLILPSAANITTAAGDTAKFISEGSGNWRCEWYQKTDGRAVTGSFTGVSSVEVIRKAADETVNNSSTLQNDDDFVAAVAANENFRFELQFSFQGNSIADIKFTFTVPSGCSIRWNYVNGIGIGVTGTITGVLDIITSAGGPITPEGPGLTTPRTITLVGMVNNGVTAGNLQFQWAQNTAHASDTSVLADGYMTIWRE